jgi:polar amino acid transport system ATP-binding protein
MNVVTETDDVIVRAEQVRKRFGRLEVLSGIDLTVARGEVVCLIGPSGSGKSTFLRCINYLERVDGGRITVDGEIVGFVQLRNALYELKDRDAARRRAHVGMVFQNFNLFPHMTVLENLVEAPMRVLKERKQSAI